MPTFEILGSNAPYKVSIMVEYVSDGPSSEEYVFATRALAEEFIEHVQAMFSRLHGTLTKNARGYWVFSSCSRPHSDDTPVEGTITITPYQFWSDPKTAAETSVLCCGQCEEEKMKEEEE